MIKRILFKLIQLFDKESVQKIVEYDLLNDNIQGLRRALETQQRSVDDLLQQLDERDTLIEQLRKEYATLEARQSEEGVVSLQAERLALFKRLQSLYIQLPTLQNALAAGADITAQDVMTLLKPLDELLIDYGFTPIGQAGDEIAYDPTRHKLVNQAGQDISPSDRVRVRYVGYLYEDDVVCKAEVTPVSR